MGCFKDRTPWRSKGEDGCRILGGTLSFAGHLANPDLALSNQIPIPPLLTVVFVMIAKFGSHLFDPGGLRMDPKAALSKYARS